MLGNAQFLKNIHFLNREIGKVYIFLELRIYLGRFFRAFFVGKSLFSNVVSVCIFTKNNVIGRYQTLNR